MDNRSRDDRLAHLATAYLKHLVSGGELSDPDLADAERAYVLWDWEGLASLAYAQYLAHGRGAFLGPRTVSDRESITIAFDYVPATEFPMSATPSPDAVLRTYLDHYHPDYDLVVVWRRRDGSTRYEMLRHGDRHGFLPPRDLYLHLLDYAKKQPAKPN